ncbi:MAG: ATP-binding cassette domain-containing protein [Thermotogota bacterium]|nr:ATP-binding cassette domain-containing protein [Thermotogota bacterium]
MEEIVIEARNLTKQFKQVLAVDNVSFRVKKGEIFGLLGPNGAGKSTTIRMLTALTKPTDGKAFINGYDVVKEAKMVRKNIGLVSEKIILYDRLTAMENLMFFAKLNNMNTKKAKKRCNKLLEMVEMTEWKNTRVSRFSTGMKQRINVIRSLLHDPEIIFLDEPTLGLDPQTTRSIREFIRELNEQGKTIVLTTHIMVEADNLSDRIAIIDHGKIAAMDTSKNLKRMIDNNETSIIDLDIPNITNPMLSTINELHCVEKVFNKNSEEIRIYMNCDDPLEILITLLKENNIPVKGIKTVEPTLEDVFIKLTGHEMRDNPGKQAENRFENRRIR